MKDKKDVKSTDCNQKCSQGHVLNATFDHPNIPGYGGGIYCDLCSDMIRQSKFADNNVEF